ncbi:competence protein ComK [Pueribacillus theae]|uniref:competence protein ComK n=1 Tax=Pueribacillus theae TaxID=2171751 RepID=UPI001403B5B3|nr:competence protein ComK [Pueribacillus theae]
MRIHGEYIMTSDTMALVPHLNQYGELWSFGMELNRTILIRKNPKTILNDSCKFFGSSYEGRVDGTKAIMNRGKMYPIAICVPLDMYMFPLVSPNNYTCVWLSYVHIRDIDAYQTHHAKITFMNEQQLIVTKSKKLVESKKFRTGELRHQLKVRSNFDVVAESPLIYQLPQIETDLWNLVLDEKKGTYEVYRR